MARGAKKVWNSTVPLNIRKPVKLALHFLKEHREQELGPGYRLYLADIARKFLEDGLRPELEKYRDELPLEVVAYFFAQPAPSRQQKEAQNVA
jgi:hypothetical protein